MSRHYDREIHRYIIKANASMLSDPWYFNVDDKGFTEYLESRGWMWIECREITKRDAHIEGCLKRCANMSKAEQSNLRDIFNLQEV